VLTDTAIAKGSTDNASVGRSALNEKKKKKKRRENEKEKKELWKK
jgi:hypothetical protein